MRCEAESARAAEHDEWRCHAEDCPIVKAIVLFAWVWSPIKRLRERVKNEERKGAIRLRNVHEEERYGRSVRPEGRLVVVLIDEIGGVHFSRPVACICDIHGGKAMSVVVSLAARLRCVRAHVRRCRNMRCPMLRCGTGVDGVILGRKLHQPTSAKVDKLVSVVVVIQQQARVGMSNDPGRVDRAIRDLCPPRCSRRGRSGGVGHLASGSAKRESTIRSVCWRCIAS